MNVYPDKKSIDIHRQKWREVADEFFGGDMTAADDLLYLLPFSDIPDFDDVRNIVEFVRDNLTDKEAAVERVRALHYPIEGIHCTIVCAHRYCVDDMQDQCEWPCPTARAIEGDA